ncbi:TPA: hypothetical protein LAP77_003062 [Escherichia coli]|nr:hypothetical protein [Escherichia coli]HBJ0986194.1 hypothetical protein [Escherichia coli]
MKIKFNLIVFFMALIVHYEASAGITKLDGSTQGTQVSVQVQITSKLSLSEVENPPTNTSMEISLENILAKSDRGALVKIQPVYIDSFYCANSDTRYGPAYISNDKVIVRTSSGKRHPIDNVYRSTCIVRFFGRAKINSGDFISPAPVQFGNTVLDASCRVLNLNNFIRASAKYSGAASGNVGNDHACLGQKDHIADSAIYTVSYDRPPVSITGTAYTPDLLVLSRGEKKELLRWSGTGPVNYFISWSIPGTETIRLIDKSGSVITNQRGILNDGESVYLEYSVPNVKGIHSGFATVGLELR